MEKNVIKLGYILISFLWFKGETEPSDVLEMFCEIHTNINNKKTSKCFSKTATRGGFNA